MLKAKCLLKERIMKSRGFIRGQADKHRKYKKKQLPEEAEAA